jgi:hypothetical protein
MTTQATARKMLDRNGYEYDAHGSGWGFYIHRPGTGRVFYTPLEAIALVIDHEDDRPTGMLYGYGDSPMGE